MEGVQSVALEETSRVVRQDNDQMAQSSGGLTPPDGRAGQDSTPALQDGAEVVGNPVGQLQELMMREKLPLPVYSVSVEEHRGQVLFLCTVSANGFTAKGMPKCLICTYSHSTFLQS